MCCYKGKCEKEKKSYVKSLYYSYIFYKSFNIDFHIPKTWSRKHENFAESWCWLFILQKKEDRLQLNRNDYIKQGYWNSGLTFVCFRFLFRMKLQNKMKYSLAGYSCVQDWSRNASFPYESFFLGVPLELYRNGPYLIIQLKTDDLKDHNNSSRMLYFANVPFTKLFRLWF